MPHPSLVSRKTENLFHTAASEPLEPFVSLSSLWAILDNLSHTTRAPNFIKMLGVFSEFWIQKTLGKILLFRMSSCWPLETKINRQRFSSRCQSHTEEKKVVKQRLSTKHSPATVAPVGVLIQRIFGAKHVTVHFVQKLLVLYFTALDATVLCTFLMGER